MSEPYVVNQDAISTRNRAKSIARKVTHGNHDQLDLSEVEFVSRSVADELVKQSESSGFELKGMDGDVEDMFDLVQRGRKAAP